MKNFIEKKEIKVNFYEFSKPVLSVDSSAKELNVDPERIVKSLIFVDEEGTPLLVIVTGDKRVDEERLSEVHGQEVRLAKAREVEEFSGYKIGEVPPVGLVLKTFVDSKVMDFDTVIAGGGSTHALIKIGSADIVEVNGAKVADIGTE
ncbi:hypothetical protein AKJ58_00845 [candidate division MSBL1 archaeon SCGC-AAA385D11]|uniref:YbaK/aminoacyl-tRNA synthetase-associated domain-containing protein n=1 Tax=candidate division MSBL1 archaeon SCGC-AAA385D11 TaxID=1698286 RepID=A0A133VNT3_9EURY|nr:hypothetical protein AKJ58_00845 [candidate division MSBL1 archaeon SCGC-AAA385D11]